MLVFIDESGDPGFKLAKGSSPVFVAAMVVFNNHDEAALAQKRIREMLGTVHRRPEFKFNNCRDEVRDHFFRKLADCEYSVRAIVVRKELIWSERLRNDERSFYSFFIKSMMKFDNQTLRRAKVFIDGSGDRMFRESFLGYLKQSTSEGAVGDIKLRNSKSEPLLQLADMCVGAIARSYRTDRGSPDRWRKAINEKIDDV